MADISKFRVNGVDYDLKDSTARTDLEALRKQIPDDLKDQLAGLDDMKEQLDGLEDMKDQLSGLEDIERRLAELEYKPMEILTLTNSVGTKELGTVVASATVSWSLNKEPASQTLNGESLAADVRSVDVGPLSETTKYTIVATDDRGVTVKKETTASFYNGVYYGALAPGAAIDSSVIQGLTRKLRSNNGASFTAGGNGKRPVYACPSRYGTPTITINNFAYDWNKVATLEFTNSSDYTETYDVWMHGQDVAEAIPVVVS